MRGLFIHYTKYFNRQVELYKLTLVVILICVDHVTHGNLEVLICNIIILRHILQNDL